MEMICIGFLAGAIVTMIMICILGIIKSNK